MKTLIEDASIKRRETILATAIEVLYESGIQGLTTKEIAKREGVSEPAIYRHFSGKLDIVLSIIDQFGQYDESIRNTIREQEMAPLAAIRYFMESYASFYDSSPQFLTLMFSYDVYRYDPEASARMGAIMAQRNEFLRGLVETGQALGEIDGSVPAKAVAHSIMGALLAAAYDPFKDEEDGSLREEVLRTVNWILRKDE